MNARRAWTVLPAAAALFALSGPGAGAGGFQAGDLAPSELAVPAPLKPARDAAARALAAGLASRQNEVSVTQDGSANSAGVLQTGLDNCSVSCDHIPRRSWPLFRARAMLGDMIAGFSSPGIQSQQEQLAT